MELEINVVGFTFLCLILTRPLVDINLEAQGYPADSSGGAGGDLSLLFVKACC